jgi:predicted Zn finger-like uncharacterized protein
LTSVSRSWLIIAMVEQTTTRMNCPHCGAAYRVVQIEAQSDPVEIACKSCGGPLDGRNGRFLLKYFLVDKRGRAKAPAQPTPLQMPR